MTSIKEAQDMVRYLEQEKGFSKNISDKIIWLAEELGELCHAYKHNNKNKMAEEAIDIFFFVVSILDKLGVNGDDLFIKKYNTNLGRIAVSTGSEQHFDQK
jgi:NTP pyrophosphatase (non-canonical NTP hydrolase)